jgi:hypothetical protein
MNPFLYEVQIPSTKENIYFKELTNRQFKALVKTLINQNYTIFQLFLDSLIEELSFYPLNANSLTGLDKTVILLTVRAYNISPTVTLQAPLKNSKDNKGKIGIDIDVNEMLSILDNDSIQHTFNIKDGRGVVVTGTIPKLLYYSDIFEVLASCISTITLKDKLIDMSDFTAAEKMPIVSRLPSEAFTQIFKFIEAQNKLFESSPIIDISSKEQLDVDEKQVYVSLLNGSLMEVIKLVYEVNLKDFYTAEHSLMYRFKYDWNAINESTPAEISLYYKLIAEDIKRERDQMAKQQNDNKMPMPKAPTTPGG